MNTFTIVLIIILAIVVVLAIQTMRIVAFRMKHFTDEMTWYATTYMVLFPFEKGHEYRNVRSLCIHYYSLLSGYTLTSIKRMYYADALLTTLRDDDNKLSFSEPLLEKRKIEEELIRIQNCCADFIKDFVTPMIVDKLFDVSDSTNQYFALAYHTANEIRDDIDNDGRRSPYSAHIREFAETNSIDIETLMHIARTVITKQKHGVVERRIKSKGE